MRSLFSLNGKSIASWELQYEPSYVDTFFSSAYYDDDGDTELTDDELDELTNKYQDVIYELHYENQLGHAEDLYQGDR